MKTITSKEIYDELRDLVDEACSKCDFRIAIKGAESIGMIGGRDEKNIFNLDYKFESTDAGDTKVAFAFHSYDQSKAFDVQPDMNKFTVTLTHPNRITEVHKNDYEG